MALSSAASSVKCLVICVLIFPYRTSTIVDASDEKTLAMIKPDGVSGNYIDIIRKTILDSGFSITQEMQLQLKEDTVKSFYAEHAAKSFFSSLLQYMTSGPVLIMVLEKPNAVADWRFLMGPTDANKAKTTHPKSVRAFCGVDLQRNCVHGSDSRQSAAREISFFFGKSTSGSVLKHDEFKFNAGLVNKRPNSVVNTYDTKKEFPKQEVNDWPHGLLTIGTFGNTGVRDHRDEIQVDQTPESTEIPEEEQCSSPDLSEFNVEIKKLQKVLTKLVSRKPVSKAEEAIADLPLDRFLNCPSSLEVDRTISNRFSTILDDHKDEEEIDRTIRIILGRCNDVCETKNAIGKKSLSFLLEKIFVCRRGFAPTPSLRDTFQESRMEKLLRTMLTKIYHQNSSKASTSKKYLEDCRHTMKEEKEDDQARIKIHNGSKWDKTDSEYIVLEI